MQSLAAANAAVAAANAAAAAAAHTEYVKAIAGAVGVVAAALIAAIIGTLGAAWITAGLQRKRNEQDRESQWRSHAIELTKLDAERLMKRAAPGQKVRPFILTFLANYRDLQELGARTPAQLYLKIQADRVSEPEAKPRRRKRTTTKPAKPRKKPATPRKKPGPPPSRG